jgi:hypothetical protein
MAVVLDYSLAKHFPLGPINGAFDLTANGRVLTLDEPFAFEDGDFRIEVPAFFSTDFNSVPRALWVWFPPWECPEAALVHDWCYRVPDGRSRGDVDKIHRRIMEIKGERTSKRNAVYLGIRAGGWKTWNKYRNEQKEKL